MTEKLITRLDFCDNQEKPERYEAINELTRIGLFIPLSELETYHGRVAKADSVEWKVNPNFSNSGNNTGNYNVNGRATLYTGEKSVAENFAAVRSKQGDGYNIEIHKIISDNPMAVVIDGSFKLSNLSDQDKSDYFEALKRIKLGVMAGSPVDFADRYIAKDIIREVDKLLRQKSGSYVSYEDETHIADEIGVDLSVVDDLCTAFNTHRGLTSGDMVYFASKFLGTGEKRFDFEINKDDGNKYKAGFNTDYLASYFRANNIVGVKQCISSATLGHDIASVSLFDLEKVNTESFIEHRKNLISRRLGPFAVLFSGIIKKDEYSDPSVSEFKNVLNMAFSGPDKIVNAAAKVKGFEKIFEADAGNWEGFTLAEHTETVLRNFDENFADRLPVGMLAPMRLALLTHDIGKSVAVAAGDKFSQRLYNKSYADRFMKEAGIDTSLRCLIVGMISDGMDLIHKIHISKNEKAKQEIKRFAKDELSKFYDIDDMSSDQIAGYIDMCRMLLVCDGGAYTSMGVTRDRNNKVIYRNSPSFNGSFCKPNDFRKNSLKLK